MLLQCYYTRLLILRRMLTRASCDMAALIPSLLQMSATLPCALGIFLKKPLVWISLQGRSPRGHPHGGHVHVRWRESPSVGRCLFCIISISCEELHAKCTLCPIQLPFFLAASSSPSTYPTHAPTHLLIYHFLAHIDVFWRLPTGLAIAARLFCIQMRESQLCLVLSIFSWIQIIKAWGRKKKKGKTRDLFHCISSGWFLWHLTELFYLIKKGDKCKGEPLAVNFKTPLSMILIPHRNTNVPFPRL